MSETNYTPLILIVVGILGACFFVQFLIQNTKVFITSLISVIFAFAIFGNVENILFIQRQALNADTILSLIGVICLLTLLYLMFAPKAPRPPNVP